MDFDVKIFWLLKPDDIDMIYYYKVFYVKDYQCGVESSNRNVGSQLYQQKLHPEHVDNEIGLVL